MFLTAMRSFLFFFFSSNSPFLSVFISLVSLHCFLSPPYITFFSLSFSSFSLYFSPPLCLFPPRLHNLFLTLHFFLLRLYLPLSIFMFSTILSPLQITFLHFPSPPFFTILLLSLHPLPFFHTHCRTPPAPPPVHSD